MFLNERFLVKSELLEMETKNLPQGVLLRVTYPVCNIGERNHNNRIYEVQLWEQVLAEKDLKEKLAARTLFGHAEHPETTASNVEKVSHVITKMWLDEEIGKLKQTFEVLDTPYGRIVATLLNANCGLGCSTRAEGDLEEKEDDKGKYHRVIPESYRYITTDFTADPSTIGVYPESIENHLVSQVKAGMEAKKMDPAFACALLEGMKSKDAKVLLESIKEMHGGDAHSKPASDMESPPMPPATNPEAALEAMYTCPKCGKEAMYEITSEKINCECGSFMKKNEQYESRLVFEDFDAAVAWFTEAFAKIADEELQDKVRQVKGALTESRPSAISKQMRSLRGQLAESKAELSVLGEIDEERASGLIAAIKQVAELEALMATVESKSHEDKEAFGRKLMKSLKASMKERLATEATSRQKLEAKYSTVSSETGTLRAKIEELQGQVATQAKAHNQELIKKYAQVTVEKTGLKLSKQFQALLEKASSETEVDNMLDRVRDEITEGMIHSAIPALKVKPDASEPKDVISESIHSAMEGM